MSWIYDVFLYICVGFGIIMTIFSIIKKFKMGEIKHLFDSDGFDELKDVANKINEEIEQSVTITCEYCGSKVKRVEEKCPNCGATIKNKNE